MLARKTRLRKKFFFEALQKKAAALRRENARLREAVRRRVGAAEAQRVLAGCHAALPQVVVECTDQAAALLARPDHTMLGLLQDLRPSFCVTDPNLPDNPIVFVSNGFLRLTGYAREQVIGRNCRFLQGPGTDPAAIAKLRASIGEGKDVSVLFLNYKADRTPFWNNVFIAALRDRGGRVVNFVGVQNPVDAERADEDGGPTGSPPPPLLRGPPGGGSGGGGRGASPGGPPFIPGPPGAPPMLPPSTSGGPHGRGAGAGGAGGGMLSVV
uniref:PAS domain-containing protein n=1 Tax=Heterosigma akashiwo TaxID=2829 RepID=A0A7S4DAW3_HETAK